MSVMIAIIILTIMGMARSMTGAGVVAVLLLAALLLFSALTVAADQEKIAWHFGPGVIRKAFLYGEIESIKQVRNHWLYGWGIRWFGKGWLYNVQGLDALELKLKNGKIIRIGTDEPEKLLSFINRWNK
jgi:hypothetical protein